jgi:hypothetical protein
MDKRSVMVGLAKKQYNHYGQCLLREDGTKAPTSNTKKGEMISWLKVNKISFCLNIEFCLETKPFISPHITSIGLNSQW